MHGHSYTVVIHVSGDVEVPTGWVIDFAAIDSAFQPLRERLDHSLLNELDDLHNPTCENVVNWIWQRLAPILRGLCRRDLWETAASGCSLRAEDL